MRHDSFAVSSTDPLPPSDAPGTFASWTSAPVAEATDIAGSPVLQVRLDSKAAAATQAAGPSGQLVVFAKIYDVAPDGTQTLHNRLISPVRVADVTQRVRIELPGVVQRFEKGHRIRLVLAASDAAYAGNTAVLPVTVAAEQKNPAELTLPVVAGPGPAAAPAPIKKPTAGAGATGSDDSAGGATDAGARPGGSVAQRGPGSGVGGESVAVLGSGALASTGADGRTTRTIATAGLLLLLLGGVLVLAARSR